MKIRMGFVTNSSSSSFIVAFDREINDVDDVVQVVTDIVDRHGFVDIDPSLVSGALDELLRDADDRKPLIRAFASHLYPYVRGGARVLSADGGFEAEEDYYDCYYYYTDGSSFRERLKSFIEENKDKYIYAFEIGDDTRVGSCLEHGNMLRRLPHIVVNMH